MVKIAPANFQDPVRLRKPVTGYGWMILYIWTWSCPPVNGSYQLPLSPSYLNGKAGLGGVLFAEIFIAAFAFLLRLSLNYEIERARAIEYQNLHLQSELRFLKAQMNPHFLFNTLNNIYSLIVVKSVKAETALMRLSDLLRYMLYESTGKVNLQKELKVLYAYIELFQLRFEQKLSTHLRAQHQSRSSYWTGSGWYRVIQYKETTGTALPW